MTSEGVLKDFTKTFQLSDLEEQILNHLSLGKFSIQNIAIACSSSEAFINTAYNSLLEKTACISRSEVLAKFLTLFCQKNDNPQLSEALPTVFVVDDEPDICQIIASYFEQEGIKARTFTDPEVCLAELSKSWPDVIVSDVRMPGLDGVEFFNEVQRKYKNFPEFVFVSGQCSDLQLGLLKRQGATAILSKPVNPEFLTETVLQAFYTRMNENRRPVRLPAQLQVKIDSHQNLKLQSGNIGIGGIFLVFDSSKVDLLDVQEEFVFGKELKLEIQLDELTAPVVVEGQVAWVRGQNEATQDAGVGIQFLNFFDGSDSEILDFVKSKRVLSVLEKAKSIAA